MTMRILAVLITLISFSNSAFAKTQQIPEKYFLEINLSQKECEKTIKENCFYRDSAHDDKYYHQTKLTIFNKKIFATQNSLFFAVKNGNYKFFDEKNNLISFNVKNGAVSNLKLIKGNLNKEKEITRCTLTQAVYGFNKAYDESQLIVKTDYFEDGYNFKGLQEFMIFSEKSTQEEVFAMSNKTNETPTPINELRLCKQKISGKILVKYVNKDQCDKNNPDIDIECKKFNDCEDYLVTKNCEVIFLKDAMG